MRIKSILLVLATAFATVVPARSSPINLPPPAGAILDLDLTPIPGGGDGQTFQTYSVDFTANLTNTDITVAFRDDPAFLVFESASVVDLTTSSVNLLTNGDFSGGTHLSNGNSGTPSGWEYANVFGATFGGVVENSPGFCGAVGTAFCWYDGAVQAYDAIDQFIPTNIGDIYRASFSLAENSSCFTNGGPPCDFHKLSTNGDITDTGGNGIDVTTYAQAGLPPPGVPEPSSLLIVGTGLLALAGFVRRFRR